MSFDGQRVYKLMFCTGKIKLTAERYAMLKDHCKAGYLQVSSVSFDKSLHMKKVPSNSWTPITAKMN